MTECSNADIRDLLPDFVHRTLDRTAHARVAEHVMACEVCREDVVLLEHVRLAFSDAPSIDTAAIVEALPRRVRRTYWRMPAFQAAASIAILAVGSLSVVLIRGGSGVGSDSASAPAAETVSAAEGGLTFGDRLSELDDADLSALLDEVRHISTITVSEPRTAVPILSAGGTN